METTPSTGTSQKREIFDFVSSRRGVVHRTATMSGWRPRALISLTLCWVGFVFCSPSVVVGARVTWTKAMFPISSFRSCLIASRNGIPSMSPTVPPTSMTQTSQPLSRATRLIRSLISLVMWGMIWTVFPRYSPRRSFSMTVL
ncbi:MAG: hypothetical protein A4E50_00992 [Methanosaeta sp. PtaB.Bin087]|nr:MAG: hypothetical protein A4E50_00992 [Methanosaeta sp. PtaB.Bin087]